MVQRWPIASTVMLQPSLTMRFGFAPWELEICRQNDSSVSVTLARKRLDSSDQPRLVLDASKHDRERKGLACPDSLCLTRHILGGGGCTEWRGRTGWKGRSVAIIDRQDASRIVPPGGQREAGEPFAVVRARCLLVPFHLIGPAYNVTVNEENSGGILFPKELANQHGKSGKFAMPFP